MPVNSVFTCKYYQSTTAFDIWETTNIIALRDMQTVRFFSSFPCLESRRETALDMYSWDGIRKMQPTKCREMCMRVKEVEAE